MDVGEIRKFPSAPLCNNSYLMQLYFDLRRCNVSRCDRTREIAQSEGAQDPVKSVINVHKEDEEIREYQKFQVDSKLRVNQWR